MTPNAFVVIFTSQLNQNNEESYGHYAKSMAQLVQKQPGYLGHYSFRKEDGFGVTLSYWENETAIQRWKNEAAHVEAQEMGRNKFYEHYTLEIAQIFRRYSS